MLHAPYNLIDIVGKALLWASSVCWDTNNTTYVWDILAKPWWARPFIENHHGNLENTQI